MAEWKSKKSFNRTQPAFNINRKTQSNVSKLHLDGRTEQEEGPKKATKTSRQRRDLKPSNSVLDRAIGKLKNDYKNEDLLLMIIPENGHKNLFKLHIIQRQDQIHLGMIRIAEEELLHLKASKAFQKFCIIFASCYIDLLKDGKMKILLNCINNKHRPISKDTLLAQNIRSESNTSSAGDYIKNQAKKVVNYQDSFIQTEPIVNENMTFSLNDICSIIATINRSLRSTKKEIQSFFFMADKLNLSLVVRPELLWKIAAFSISTTENGREVLVESYLPGSSYLGGITVKENELLSICDLYPKLLSNIHVIEDVFELTPLPKKFVNILKAVLTFFKLELLYDAVAEFLFDLYKNFTYL